MMSSIVFAVSALFAQVAFSFNCSIPPIYVDIHPRAVHGTETFEYGAFIGIGEPAQNQSLWPSLNHNETALAAIDFCTASSPSGCAINTHGFFQPELSSR